MAISVKFIDDVCVIDPKEALTVSITDEFKKVVEDLLENGKKKLIINFENIPYIDSSGLSVLLTTSEMAEDQGGSLKLAALNQTCNTVLEITYLSDKFSIHSDIESALSDF